FLLSEILDLKANLNRDPFGTIIESKLDKGLGVVATVIVENGTMYARDFIVAGGQYGNIRSLISSDGKPLQKALPG
ncbi:translation initiation factor IF-2 domain protein, partial [Chlamydia psittaci 02DC14]